jgi:hypothetical protein
VRSSIGGLSWHAPFYSRGIFTRSPGFYLTIDQNVHLSVNSIDHRLDATNEDAATVKLPGIWGMLSWHNCGASAQFQALSGVIL